jgi:hypothetical protein
MSTYKVILELNVELDNPDDLEDVVYYQVRDLMYTDLLSACEVEEIN